MTTDWLVVTTSLLCVTKQWCWKAQKKNRMTWFPTRHWGLVINCSTTNERWKIKFIVPGPDSFLTSLSRGYFQVVGFSSSVQDSLKTGSISWPCTKSLYSLDTEVTCNIYGPFNTMINWNILSTFNPNVMMNTSKFGNIYISQTHF